MHHLFQGLEPVESPIRLNARPPMKRAVADDLLADPFVGFRYAVFTTICLTFTDLTFL